MKRMYRCVANILVFLVLVLVFVQSSKAQYQNDTSVVINDIEYYTATFKSTYQLGEAVNICHRLTNAGYDPLYLVFHTKKLYDFSASLSGEEIWCSSFGREYEPDTQVVVLEPGESWTETKIWLMRDNAGNLVQPGEYTIKGEISCNVPVSFALSVPINIEYLDTVSVAVPDTTASQGITFDLPVVTEGVPKDLIYGLDFTLTFNPEILSVQDVSSTGTLTEKWGVPTFNNTVDGHVCVSISGSSALDSSGILLVLRMEVSQSAIEGDTTAISFESMRFNEGVPFAATTNGIFEVKTGTGIEESEYTQAHPEFMLFQNYPNPFNATCQIRYSLSYTCHVKLAVYNLLGQKVRILIDKTQGAGFRLALWDGKDDSDQEVASGIYLYKLEVGQFKDVKRMVIIK